jgi:hypothetical protein
MDEFRDEQDKAKETEVIRRQMKDELIDIYEDHFGVFDRMNPGLEMHCAPWSGFAWFPDGYEFPKSDYFSFYVLEFRDYIDGYFHISAGLIDCPQRKNRDGYYELAMAVPNSPIEVADLILMTLAGQVRKHQLNHNDLIQYPEEVTSFSNIAGFVARNMIDLSLRGQEFQVLCLVGLTEGEMAYAREHGADIVMALLGEDYLMTDHNRNSCIEYIEQ